MSNRILMVWCIILTIILLPLTLNTVFETYPTIHKVEEQIERVESSQSHTNDAFVDRLDTIETVIKAPSGWSGPFSIERLGEELRKYDIANRDRLTEVGMLIHQLDPDFDGIISVSLGGTDMCPNKGDLEGNNDLNRDGCPDDVSPYMHAGFTRDLESEISRYTTGGYALVETACMDKTCWGAEFDVRDNRGYEYRMGCLVTDNARRPIAYPVVSDGDPDPTLEVVDGMEFLYCHPTGPKEGTLPGGTSSEGP